MQPYSLKTQKSIIAKEASYLSNSDLIQPTFNPGGSYSASGFSRRNPVDFEELEDPLLSLRIRCRGSMASVGAVALVTSTGELIADDDVLVADGDAGGLDWVGERLRKA